MTIPDSYSMATRAMLYSTAPTPLKLSWHIDDPAAVRLELITIKRSWYVARDYLAAGLEAEETLTYTDRDFAAAVYCSRRGSSDTLLVLRNRLCDHVTSRYPMSVNTEALARFLRITYGICPVAREAELLAAGLDTQLGLLAATQEGRQS